MKEILTMSQKEVDCFKVISPLEEKTISVAEASEMLASASLRSTGSSLITRQ